MMFTIAAILPPGAWAVKLYSPSPRQFGAASEQTFVGSVVATPFKKRGSNAHAAPGLTAAVAVNVFVGPPPNGVKVIVGVLAVAPTFCTTIVDIRPPFAFFTAYAP